MDFVHDDEVDGLALDEGADALGRIGLLERFVVEDQITVRFRVRRGPVGANVLAATMLSGKISRIFSHQPSTTLFGQQTTVNWLPTTREARTAASVLPAPVPDQLPTRFLLADADGEMSLHEVRRRSLAVDAKGVAVRNGEVFCLAILVKEP